MELENRFAALQDLARAARLHPAYVEHGTCLIQIADMESMISVCEREQLLIFGVEGFHCRNGNIIPDMDAILDLSSLSRVPWDDAFPESLASLRSFVCMLSGDKGMLFEFTFATREEFEQGSAPAAPQRRG